MRLKQKLKTFFKTKDSSEHGVELLRMWILPFMKFWDPKASVDDALAAFFATNERKFYHGKAVKDFRMPGLCALAGDRWSKQLKERQVKKGQYMLIAADRPTQTTRVDIMLEGKMQTMKLSRAQTEFLKDYVNIWK